MCYPSEVVLDGLALDAGLAVEPAYDLLRTGSNLIYLLPQQNLVARVSRKPRQQVQANLEIVNALARYAPVLAPAKTDVAVYGEWTASFWPRGTDASHRPVEFGDTLSVLHSCEPPAALPRINPLAPVPERLEKAAASGVPEKYLSQLADRASLLEEPCKEMTAEGGELLHGDAHIGNFMDFDGRLLLIDLDDLCIGPWQYDFVPSLTASIHMANPQFYRSVIGDRWEKLMGWQWIGTAVKVREVTMLTWLASMWGDGEKAQNELALRMDENNKESVWNPL